MPARRSDPARLLAAVNDQRAALSVAPWDGAMTAAGWQASAASRPASSAMPRRSSRFSGWGACAARRFAGLGARQLVLLTDVDGVRDADGRRLDTLTSGEAETLIESGGIGGGMVPKIRAALAALAWDGSEAIIADSAAPGALERALGDPSFGTRITAGRPAVGAV